MHMPVRVGTAADGAGAIDITSIMKMKIDRVPQLASWRGGCGAKQAAA
jgi:hypothetical protein